MSRTRERRNSSGLCHKIRLLYLVTKLSTRCVWCALANWTLWLFWHILLLSSVCVLLDRGRSSWLAEGERLRFFLPDVTLTTTTDDNSCEMLLVEPSASSGLVVLLDAALVATAMVRQINAGFL